MPVLMLVPVLYCRKFAANMNIDVQFSVNNNNSVEFDVAAKLLLEYDGHIHIGASGREKIIF